MASCPDNQPKEPVPLVKNDLPLKPAEDPTQILLETKPDEKSFIFRYFLAFTPCILVLVSIIARDITAIIFRTFFSAVDSTVSSITGPASMNTLTQDSYYGMVPNSLSTITGALPDATNIAIFMIAPVGIFIIIAAIGWSLRITEVWTGTIMSLGLSAAVGLLFVVGPERDFQTGFLLYLQWIAFLVQPFCILGTAVVLFWLIKFRQSLRYTITRTGIWIRGGVFKKQEHLIPHSQIGRVVLEQNFLGSRYNFGTVIPVTLTRWGAETSIRGIGATGQQGNVGGGILFAKGREEASRTPLDSLYGIPDPEHAQAILARVITQQDLHEAEQVSLLKKIYDAKTRNYPADEPVQPQVIAGSPKGQPPSPEPDVSPVERITDTGPAASTTGDAVIYIDTIESRQPMINTLEPTMREVPFINKIHPVPQEEAVPRQESIPDQIKKLAELRDAGILTEEEFQAKKTELLGRM